MPSDIHFDSSGYRKSRTDTVEKWKKLYLEFAPQTTIHGVKEFTADDHINMKILWAFLMVGCIIGTSYGVQQLFLQYAESPTASSVNHITPLYFPTVSLCPRQWVDPHNANFFYRFDCELQNFLKLMAWYTFEYYENLIHGSNISLIEIRQRFKQRIQEYKVSNLTDLYSRVSYDPDHIITLDKYIVNPVVKKVRASGVCYIMNFTLNDTRQNNGARAMDYFMLVSTMRYTIATDANCSLATDPYSGTSTKGGQNYYSMETYNNVLIGGDAAAVYSENRYPIQANKSFSFKIRATKHSYPKKQTSKDCGATSDYQQLNCINQCRAEYINSALGCKFFFGPGIDEAKDFDEYCLMQEEMSTITDVVDLIHASNISVNNESFQQCLKINCKLPCDQYTFEPIILSLGLPDGYSTAQAHPQATLEFEYRNYFSSISITETSVYSWPNVMGNIGGMISLWTGCSFISLCHIVYHFFLRQICPRPKTVARISRNVSASMLRRASMLSDRSMSLRPGKHRASSTTLQDLYVSGPKHRPSSIGRDDVFYADMPSSPGSATLSPYSPVTNGDSKFDTFSLKLNGTLKKLQPWKRSKLQPDENGHNLPIFVIEDGLGQQTPSPKQDIVQKPDKPSLAQSNAEKGIDNTAFEFNDEEDDIGTTDIDHKTSNHMEPSTTLSPVQPGTESNNTDSPQPYSSHSHSFTESASGADSDTSTKIADITIVDDNCGEMPNSGDFTEKVSFQLGPASEDDSDGGVSLDNSFSSDYQQNEGIRGRKSTSAIHGRPHNPTTRSHSVAVDQSIPKKVHQLWNFLKPSLKRTIADKNEDNSGVQPQEPTVLSERQQHAASSPRSRIPVHSNSYRERTTLHPIHETHLRTSSNPPSIGTTIKSPYSWQPSPTISEHLEQRRRPPDPNIVPNEEFLPATKDTGVNRSSQEDLNIIKQTAPNDESHA